MSPATNSDRQTGFRDKQDDLISILSPALEGVTTDQSCIQDAEKRGVQELCHFFKEIQQQQI